MPHLTSDMKLKPNDLLERMGPPLYEAAYKKGMSLSAYLEVYEDPSDEYKDNDGLDAFGRVLQAAEIRTKSLPQIGLYASEFNEFYEQPNRRALFPEFVSRIFREVKTGKSANTAEMTRDLYGSGDAVAGSWRRPYVDADEARWDQQIQPAIPLSEVIAINTPIDGDSYRSFYLTHDANKTGMKRVAETAEVPAVKLTGNDHTIDLHKYGRRLVASYEQLRRQRIDLIALHLRQIAIQTEVDKLADIIDVMVNGDGNNNAAVAYDLDAIDTAATSGTMTLKGWLGFKLKFDGAYILTHALTREATLLQMYMLQMGSGNVPLVTLPNAFGGLTPINRGLSDGVRIGHTSAAPANTIVGFDARFAIQQLVEIGSNITEVEKFTTRQTQDITVTEVVGYAVLDKNAVRVLNVTFS
jgi:hypothetical protein